MAWFNNDFLTFFNELEKNNNKEWFDENRKRYENSIKIPFKAFTEELILKMNEEDPEIKIEAKDAIFRINRDIRFSKDKTPYKTNLSALISRGGKKDKTTPGLYLQMNHVDTRIYSGVHMLEKKQLLAVRQHIYNNLDEFSELISEKKFVSTFGDILGEKNKIIPKEFQDAAQKQPLLYNKSFYYYKKFDPKIILEDTLIDQLIDSYSVGYALRDFFSDALLEAE